MCVPDALVRARRRVFAVAAFQFFLWKAGYDIVSVPERSKGVDSSSTVFALVGSNPTTDTLLFARPMADTRFRLVVVYACWPLSSQQAHNTVMCNHAFEILHRWYVSFHTLHPDLYCVQ